jgi:hypothetical protein
VRPELVVVPFLADWVMTEYETVRSNIKEADEAYKPAFLKAFVDYIRKVKKNM